ncbi:MAG: P-loop NTPase [Byssovorax sp.]
MTSRLHCYSFHSVKGGVGKSTLSLLTAVALATENPDARVVLIDMDLTGTSLADVLPLEAPRWNGVGARDRIDLSRAPDDFLRVHDTRPRIEERGEIPPDEGPVGVPFLNDYLLFTPPGWNAEKDVPPDAILWRLPEGPKNLRVIPSSALPRDLVKVLPVIYDEEHAAFLEGRLEYLLSALLAEGGDLFVVFDTPPTVPGLSRSVLSLALRLARHPKVPLSDDGFMPKALQDADVAWEALLVATQDFQDIRAAARWLDLVGPNDPQVLRLLVNRVRGQEAQGRAIHVEALSDSANPLAINPLWMEEADVLRDIFRGEKAPPLRSSFLRLLDRKLS